MGSVRRRQLMHESSAIAIDDYPQYVRMDIVATEDFDYNIGYVYQGLISGYILDSDTVVDIGPYDSPKPIHISKGEHTMYFKPRGGSVSNVYRLDVGDGNTAATVKYIRLPYNISSKWYNESISNSMILGIKNKTALVDILDENILYFLLGIGSKANSGSVSNIEAIRVPKGTIQKYIDAGYGNYNIVKKMTEVKFKY